MFNKKLGQIGKTMTWVVATIIIIVILLASIFIATSYLGKHKKFDFLAKRSDLLASESFFAYLLTEDSEGQTVHEQVKNQGNLNDFNGNLAIRIFDELYGEEYPEVWIGIAPNSAVSPSIRNEYFGSKPVLKGGDPKYPFAESIKKPDKPYISQRITLDENKSIELVLAH
jgi:hypothetical protein